jgi:hypothetical protein
MQSAMTISFGAVAMVTPTRNLDLTPTDWGRIDTASVWMAEGLKEQARALVREVEDEHGVTTADRRFARIVAQGLLIVPEKATGAIHTGAPALFVRDGDRGGQLEHVLVTSEVWLHPESGEAMRTCCFLDLAGEEYDVKAAHLAPCDDLWRLLPLAPEVLETGKWAGVDRIAEPYKARPVAKAPVMDKFDRVAPIKPEDVKLDVSRMTENQRDRLRKADAALASAARRKEARARPGGGYGRLTRAEKDERVLAKETYEALAQETAAANDRAEVSRGRVETLALEHLRGARVDIHADGHLTRRNGLDTLLMSGALTHSEHVAGEKYAEIFNEAKTGEIKIANWGGAGGGSAPDPEMERERRLKQLKAKKALTDIEAFVQATVSHKRAVWALRLVAGEGRLIAHISTSGGNRATNTTALRMALGALADKWGLQ